MKKPQTKEERDKMLLEVWCLKMITLRYHPERRWEASNAVCEYLDWLDELPLVQVVA